MLPPCSKSSSPAASGSALKSRCCSCCYYCLSVCLSVFLPECIGVDCPCSHTHTERNPQTASLAATASSQEDSFLLPCHVNVLQAFPVHITMTTSPLLANIHIHTHKDAHTHSFSLHLSLSLSTSHPCQSQLFALQ